MGQFESARSLRDFAAGIKSRPQAVQPSASKGATNNAKKLILKQSLYHTTIQWKVSRKKYGKWNAWFLRSKSIKYVWHVFSVQICPSTNSIVTIQYDYIFCPELLQITRFAAPRAQYLHELAIPTKIVCNSTVLIGQLGITWPMNTYKHL